MKRIMVAVLLVGWVLPGARLAVAQGCEVSDSAQYRVTFVATWSAATLPQEFPASAHFSGLVGGSHSSSVSFWSPGALASEGIERMAETGSTSVLINEVNAAIGAGSAAQIISGGSIGTSPGSATATFDVDRANPLATIVTMIAPSPDWFVGTHGYNLFSNGNWAATASVALFGYDAGTDDGSTYIATNADTQPPAPIALLDGPLFRTGGELVPFGRFDFLRLSESCLDSDGDTIADEQDNCLLVANTQQLDGDGDGFGNACDADLNNDCIVNAADLGALRIAFFSADPIADLSGDGVVNAVDLGRMRLAFFEPPGPRGDGVECTP